MKDPNSALKRFFIEKSATKVEKSQRISDMGRPEICFVMEKNHRGERESEREKERETERKREKVEKREIR